MTIEIHSSMRNNSTVARTPSAWRITLLIVISTLAATMLSSFTENATIPACYISFASASNLQTASPDRLPHADDNSRTVLTEQGEVKVSRVDGYRILYLNSNQAPFVNLKVELSEKGAYEQDKKNLEENLRYLCLHSRNMETNGLIEIVSNGYKVIGFSRSTIDFGSTLGTFAMFPGDGVIVYFYFNNMKPEFRNFESLESYKKQRNQFIDEYTKHLETCFKK